MARWRLPVVTASMEVGGVATGNQETRQIFLSAERQGEKMLNV
jgi:hypothetical protein